MISEETLKALREFSKQLGLVYRVVGFMTWLEVMQSGYSDAQIYPRELEVLRDCDIPLNTIIIDK